MATLGWHFFDEIYPLQEAQRGPYFLPRQAGKISKFLLAHSKGTPANRTGISAFAAEFPWGPVGQINKGYCQFEILGILPDGGLHDFSVQLYKTPFAHVVSKKEGCGFPALGGVGPQPKMFLVAQGFMHRFYIMDLLNVNNFLSKPLFHIFLNIYIFFYHHN